MHCQSQDTVSVLRSAEVEVRALSDQPSWTIKMDQHCQLPIIINHEPLLTNFNHYQQPLPTIDNRQPLRTIHLLTQIYQSQCRVQTSTARPVAWYNGQHVTRGGLFECPFFMRNAAANNETSDISQSCA